MKKTRNKKNKLHLISKFLRGTRGLFLLCILAALLETLAGMLQPQIIRVAVDNVICGNEAELPGVVKSLMDRIGGFSSLGKSLWMIALAILGVAVIQAIASYLFRVLESRASGKLVKNMRDSLFAHIQFLPYVWFAKNHTGDIIQRSTSDIDTVKDFISEQLTSIVRIFLMIFISGYFMFRMNTALALIALVPVPILIIISVVFHSRISENYELCDENEGVLSAVAQENLSGMRVIRAFGRERAEIKKFEQQNGSYTTLMKKLDRQMSLFWCITDVVCGIQILSILLCGALFCINGTASEGEYIAFLTYNGMLLSPVRELGEMISNLAQAGVSLDRLYEVMKESLEADLPDAVPVTADGDIVFEHVSFHYDNAPDILHDVSFAVKARTTLGILGGTGSGKSTLMFLLDKLYELSPDAGRITVGGTDIRLVSTESLRRSIGMVLQEPYLFSESLGYNIGIAKPDATPEKIREAAADAALSDTVNGFAEGYDTFVGEGGITLSGGQKQRTAIARVLLADTPILIFDDSLSAVDTETDRKIRNSLAKRFRKATVILVSHRIATLCEADHIIVLDHGHIVEEGTHEQLKNAHGLYQRVYDTQKSVRESM